MAEMTPKNFIETVFIHQTQELVTSHPYIAFIVMGIGIEYLGKCINPSDTDWNEERVSRKRFEDAITNISAFSKYVPLIGKGSQFDLYNSLRCGLAHSAAPKFEITLSSKGEMANMTKHSGDTRMNLRCEDFFEDFKIACLTVVSDSYKGDDKMNKPFLSVPDYPLESAKLPVTESFSR